MQTDWEIWLDSNLSPIIAKWISEKLSLKVKSAYTLELNNLSDSEVYLKARAAGNVIIISKDSDFSELISRLGSPPKLISIKIGNSTNRILWNQIQEPILKAIPILTTSEIDIVEVD
jgi:predicted nuclease of predicted toxin-antitoxin system